jgi:hypothetical protein
MTAESSPEKILLVIGRLVQALPAGNQRQVIGNRRNRIEDSEDKSQEGRHVQGGEVSKPKTSKLLAFLARGSLYDMLCSGRVR